MDLAKYRKLFLEEATEHLAEMSRALLELEKTPTSADAIDRVFRMAHSIKGMAASLGYDAITELAHRIEDRMDACRSAGQVDRDGIDLLFRGLEGLERMVGQVRSGAAPQAEVPAAAASSAPAGEPPSKKARPQS